MANPEDITVTIGEDQPIYINIQGYTLVAADHNHDTRYYKKDEVDAKLAEKLTGTFDSDYMTFLIEH